MARQETPVRKSVALAVALGTGVGLLYGGSFFLPAAAKAQGYEAFFFAMVLFFYWPMWAANPVFWYGLVKLLSGRWKAARNAGLLAVVLACSEAWMFVGLLKVGYFVWVGSMAALALAGWYGGRRTRSAPAPRFDERPEPADTAIRVLR